MLFSEANEIAKLLRIGAMAEAYVMPDNLPMFL